MGGETIPTDRGRIINEEPRKQGEAQDHEARQRFLAVLFNTQLYFG